MNGYILFLGSGSKHGVPNLEHVFKNIENANRGDSPYCEICKNTIQNKDKNVRNPFSVIVKNPAENTSVCKDTFLFEMGSSFRASMLEYAIPANINRVDSIFCMGSNEQSFGGVDEVREVQRYERPSNSEGVVFYEPKIRVPMYLTSSAALVLNDWYRYIIEYSLRNDLKSRTKVGCVQLNILDPRNSPNSLSIDSLDALDDFINSNKDPDTTDSAIKNLEFKPITINYSGEIKITCLFFLDGDNKICTGYLIEYGICKRLICIIPTYDTIPKETLEFLKTVPLINILIFPIVPNDSFVINPESVTNSINFCSKMTNAKSVYFYNINCNHSHELIQQFINENTTQNSHIQFHLSFDSQIVPIHP
ncbi:hypothetical protein OIY81_1043 [Cryptosporidium canis]|nr:hypothetical protein OIY81_1043 [Cryptosporidium canis]